MKIAISGKGGVGKTTIMALLARELKRSGKEVLIVDADPSPHMAQTIGIENTDRAKPISEMTQLLIERSGKTEGSPFYNINPQVNDLLKEFIIEENGLKLMVLGAIQTGEGGCACPENNVLRRMLTKLLLSPTQFVLLDMEAGVEHLGRGTIAGVDHLLVIVNPSQSSIRTAKKIKKLADDVQIPKVSFVANLVEDDEDKQFLLSNLGCKPITYFPNARSIRKAERNNIPVIKINDEVTKPAIELMETLLKEEG